MKKILPNGFSLMEMMIVLLIVAIVAAATAPMVTKKITKASNVSEFWQDNGTNLKQDDDYKGIFLNHDNNGNTRLIESSNKAKFDIGCPNRTILLGYNDITVSGSDSIAIGTDANASDNNTIAIGNGASATINGSIAIGESAAVSDIGPNKINIGNIFKYSTGTPDKVELGTSGDYVHIPGDLVVDGNVILGVNEGSRVGIKGISGTILIGQMEENDSTKWIAPGDESTITIDQDYSVLSDRRLKNVGEKFEAGLEELKKLDLFHYTFKDDINKTPRVGVMAQDLQKVFPDAVTEGEDGYLRIRMEDMFYAVINAVKELDTRLNILVAQVSSYFDKVNELEATVKAQQQTIDELKAQNAEFEQRLEKLEKKRWNK